MWLGMVGSYRDGVVIGSNTVSNKSERVGMLVEADDPRSDARHTYIAECSSSPPSRFSMSIGFHEIFRNVIRKLVRNTVLFPHLRVFIQDRTTTKPNDSKA